MRKSSKSQRDILIESYGKDDEDAVLRVKKLYKDLRLEELYLDYEQKIYDRINALIERADALIPPAVFRDFLSKIYKRDK